MDLLDEKQITIMDEDGNQRVMEILFTYEHEERGKKYVFLYEKDNPDDIIAMEYNDEGELFEIESEEEYAEVEEVFNAFNEDNFDEEEKEN